ncbi:hypothetical protein [Roseivirga misakiensis]|uniref:FUSC family protein n=1 Tax=Roseivirga misakiensis TaxID=1563681 RepID=A0A1E5T0R6_9BACT|nr:hypothetical protein [Roseivirga misakiensis]OEK04946.1 hypothetical protein BFP71_16060 [Roseivirga misakiensis]
MNLDDINALSDEELLEAARKAKTSKSYDAVIIGLLLGVSIYSIITNGFGLLTFLPLLYFPIASKNEKHRKAILNALKERK